MVYLLKTWNVLDLSPSESTSFYVALMIVFITPTANNIMVMADLAGGGVEGAMAKIIACEYLIAPVFLSLSVMAVIRVATM